MDLSINLCYKKGTSYNSTFCVKSSDSKLFFRVVLLLSINLTLKVNFPKSFKVENIV